MTNFRRNLSNNFFKKQLICRSVWPVFWNSGASNVKILTVIIIIIIFKDPQGHLTLEKQNKNIYTKSKQIKPQL